MNTLHKSLLYTVLIGSPLLMRAGEHPVALDKNVDAAKCLECHEEKTKGAHVHSAIAMGCTTCHEVQVKDKDTTLIELTAPKEELCFTCHEKSKAASQHGPYSRGNCVLCHDPHQSEFDKQLRASGNSLCLECHRDRRLTDSRVALFKTSHELTDQEFQEIPKIGLDPTQTMGHPMGMHKVAELPIPNEPGKKISCVTCHEPHASEREELVRMVEVNKKRIDVCDSCHQANDDAAMAAAQKRADELEAQRQKEAQTQAKQPDMSPKKATKKDKKP